MTHYNTLQVPNNASKGEIQKAYKRLAFLHHPDRNPGDKKAVKSFRRVTEAYSVVSDEVKRARYDLTQPQNAAVLEEIIRRRIEELQRRQAQLEAEILRDKEREYQEAVAYLAQQEAIFREREREAKRTETVFLDTQMKLMADRVYKDVEHYSIVAMAIILGILASISLINTTWIPLLFVPAVVQIRLGILSLMKRIADKTFGVDN